MKYFLILLYLDVTSIYAQELRNYYKNFCENLNKPTCETKLESLDQKNAELLINLTNPFIAKKRLIKEARKYSSEINETIDEWADFKRYVYGLKTNGISIQNNDEKKVKEKIYFISMSKMKQPEKLPEYRRYLATIRKKFDELKENKRDREANKARLSVCYKSGCGLTRQSDLEKIAITLDLAKVAIIDEVMWFRSHNIDKYLDSNKEDALLDLVLDTQSQYFKTAFEYDAKAITLANKVESLMKTHPYSNVPLLILKASHTGNIVDFLISRMFKNWDREPDQEKSAICHMTQKQININESVETSVNFLNNFTLGLSIIPSPFTIPIRGTRIALGTEFALTLNTLGRSYFTASMLKDYEDKTKECDNLYVQSITNNENNHGIKTLNKCLDDLDAKRWNFILGLIPYNELVKFPVLVGRLKILERSFQVAPNRFFDTVQLKQFLVEGSKSINRNERFYVTAVGPDNKNISLFNLSRMQDITVNNVNNFADEYLNFVGKIYKERLSLENKLVDKFVASAKQMKNRMKVITITENTPKNQGNIFKGGMSVIESRKKGDLLPFELSTGMRVPRNPGETIVELSRVAVEKGQGSGDILKELVEHSVNLIKSDPSVTKVYYFTSKAHHRLYERFGYKGQVIKEPNKDEVVVEIDIKELLAQAS